MGLLAASRLNTARATEIRTFHPAMDRPRKRHVTASHMATRGAGPVPRARAARLSRSTPLDPTAQVAGKILLLARTTPLDQVTAPTQGLSLFYTDLDRS